MKVDRVEFMVPQEAERVSSVAHRLDGVQRGSHAASENMLGFRVDQIAEKERTATSRWDKPHGRRLIAEACHELGEFVVATVNVADDVVMHTS